MSMRFSLVLFLTACSVTPITPKLLSHGELRDSHSDCPRGASVFDAGLDDDGDGALAAAEIDSTVVLCVGDEACTVDSMAAEVVVTCKNHAPVQVSVTPGTLVVVGAKENRCVRLELGIDDGDAGGTARDGTLQDGEIDSVQEICDAVCGDGNTDEGEDCDDGDTVDGDLCDHACRAEPNCLPPTPDPACPAVTYYVDHVEVPAVRPTSGGFTVTLHGVFPPNAAVSNTVIDVAEATAASATAITFAAPPGAGIQDFTLSVSGVEIFGLDKHIGANGLFTVSYDAPLSYSYARPVLTSVSGCDATGDSLSTEGCLRAGGQTLTINGTSFGAADASVRVGDAACEPITIVGEQLTCPLPAGYNSAAVTLTVRGLAAENAAKLGYVRPVILTVQGAAVAGQPITVIGSFFGADAFDVTYGGDGKRFTCTNPVVTPDQIVCDVGDDVGAELKFVIKESSNPSESKPFASTLSFAPPVLTPFSLVKDGSGAPAQTLTIHGAGFERVSFTATGVGSDARYVRVTYGDYECTDVQLNLTTQPRGVSCTTAAGVGSYPLTIYGADQFATEELYLSYDAAAPTISALKGCSNDSASNCPTEGAPVMLTIQGERFFAPMYALVGDELCVGGPISESEIVCALPPGAGEPSVRVFSNGQLSNSYPMSYSAPSIITISGCDFGSTSCVGGDVLTISGQNFGANNARVLVGDALCAPVIHSATEAHRQITCQLPPGAGQNVPVRAFNGRFSDAFYISYK